MANIKWSKYIPHNPTKKQLLALQNNSKELLYGGALGGGKSDYLLMCGLQYADVPGYATALFRRSLSDLKLPGALLDRARDWLQPHLKSKSHPSNDVTYVGSEHTYYFKTRNPDGTIGIPARLCFCYIGEANAKDRYQSAEFQTIGFDELSQWDTMADYKFMTTRLRKTVCKKHGKRPDGKPNYIKGCAECDMKKMIPTRIRAATNPGGRGGRALMNHYHIIPDPTKYKDKREAIAAMMNDIKVDFVSAHPKRAFVPAFIDDNPYLDQTDYDEFLNDLDPLLRSQLRDGNWLARADSRFKRHDARYYKLYEGAFSYAGIMRPFSEFQTIFITVDPAGTVREGIVDQEFSASKNKSKSYTVISTWGKTKDGQLFWLDMDRFRDEIPVVVERIEKAYKKWNPAFVKIEVNGVGLGVGQYVSKLSIPVSKTSKGSDKLENSTAAQLLLKNGKVFFPENAPWIDDCEDEVFQWTGLPSEQDDIVDTLSDAAIYVGPLSSEDTDDDDYKPIITKIGNIGGIPFTSGISNSSPVYTRLTNL